MKINRATLLLFSLGLLSLGISTAAHSSKPTTEAILPEAASSAEGIKPLKVGDTIPDVTLTNPDGIVFNLKKLIKNQPTVLIFYRGGWCVYCNTQLSQLKQIEQPLQKLGYQIVAVSPDKVEKIRETLKKYDLEYMVVSDSDANAIRAFGLAFKVDDPTYAQYKKDLGLDLEEHSGKTHHILPVPAAFVLDQKGKILFSYVNPDYKVRVDGQALLKAAQDAVQKTKK